MSYRTEATSCSTLQVESAQQVFSTIELLEMILMELSIRDLLLSQRVYKAFQQTIEGSTKLQQALFMAPFEASPSTCDNPTTRQP